MNRCLLLKVTISCFSLIFSTTMAVQAQANFTKEYVTQVQGTISFETSEIQELYLVLVALSDFYKKNDFLLAKNTAYFQEVQEHFGKYSEEKIVKIINIHLERGRFNAMRMDACGFYFDKNGKIIQDSLYSSLNGENKNYLKPYLAEIQKFALHSGFRDFFREHTSFFKNLTIETQKQLPLKNLTTWFEERFTHKYEHLRVIFSPLASQKDTIVTFEVSYFGQAILFLPSALVDANYSSPMLSALMSRRAFTLLFQYYSKSIQTEYLSDINLTFANQGLWTDKLTLYPSSFALADAYFAHAFFLWYAQQNVNPENFAILYENTNRYMQEDLGLIKAEKFNNLVLGIASENPKIKLSKFYETILEGCKKL